MKNVVVWIFLLLQCIPSLMAQEIISNEIIWKGNPYAAFTSLVYYKGSYYCAFREANKHWDNTGKDCGVIKIIHTNNLKDWDEFFVFSESGYDLRDPQLSVTSDSILMLITEKVRYERGEALSRNTCVSFFVDSGGFTPLSHIVFDACQNWNWIWNVEWIDNEAVGFCYAPFFGMVKSKNGIKYELVEKLNLERNPTEASVLKINKNELLSIVRTDSVALIGVYDIGNKQWTWKNSEIVLECPKLVEVNGTYYVVGRSYDIEKNTSLFKFNVAKQDIEKIISIPGGKDCSYPGIVYKDGKLYISYYKKNEMTSDIFLAIIQL